MATDFHAQLEAARKAGRAATKTKGTSIQASVSRLMEAGETGTVEVLRGVLSEREEMPGWLVDAPDHEVAALLRRWGSVKHAMAEWKRARKAKQ